MTTKQQQDWWQTFHKFQQSREKTWRPKINSALQDQYKAVADFLKVNGIAVTITKLDFLIKHDELSKIIQNMYIDAGRVFGGKAYQMVKKNAKSKTPKAEGKALLPVGYNEDLVNEIIQYFQTSLLF
jgi:hypothetical protein